MASQTIHPKKFFRQRQEVLDEVLRKDDEQEQQQQQEQGTAGHNGQNTTAAGPASPAAKRPKKTKRKKKDKAEETLAMKLIEAVQLHPILYDTQRDDYKDTQRKNQIWRQIAALPGIEKTSEEVQNVWQNIRRSRARHEGNKRKVEKSGGAGAFKCSWVHWRMTTFLQDHIRVKEG